MFNASSSRAMVRLIAVIILPRCVCIWRRGCYWGGSIVFVRPVCWKASIRLLSFEEMFFTISCTKYVYLLNCHIHTLIMKSFIVWTMPLQISNRKKLTASSVVVVGLPFEEEVSNRDLHFIAGFSQLKSSFGSSTSPCLPGESAYTNCWVVVYEGH